MEKSDGRFKKGERRSPGTEFKPGQHWRPKREHWERDWLENEYVTKGRSAQEIADTQGITGAAVYHWLKKHGIPRRTTSEVRKAKHWGAIGEANPMFGRTGALSGRWRGGISPERQRVYSSMEWAQCVEDVWARDGCRCQRCRTPGKRGRGMNVHHLKSFEQCTDTEKCSPDMVLLLCSKCHGWVHSKNNTARDFFIVEGGATNGNAE